MLPRSLFILFFLAVACAYADDGHDHAAGAAHAPAPTAVPTPAEPSPVPAATLPEEHNDIRIVIDTSGSMKQTDPKNLRIPALKLLINLLPEGQDAGIWLFDSTAENLIPLGPINAAWKKQALASMGKINSKGAYTHIESALETAGKDWDTPLLAGQQRNLILLTDGKVDVSKKPEDSAASRERILKTLLPRLQLAGARVHTIALSAQSDQELMHQIALATGGWSEVATDAEQLQRTFIRIFNKTAPPDTVPLTDNHFEVDASIQEFTVLVTLKPGASATRLVDPKGVEINQATVPDSARWVHEDGFDLITVQTPTPGGWKLVADIDPANQVMVVTDLQMDVAPVPDVLTQADALEAFASFSERGTTIKRDDFLDLLTLDAQLTGPSESKGLTLARDTLQAERFTLSAQDALTPGEYTLTITANGQTFLREAKQTFRVMAGPMKVETRQEGDAVTIKLTPDATVIKPDSVVVKATLTEQIQPSRSLEAHHADGHWVLELPAPKAGERWIVNLDVEASDVDGKTMSVPIKPIVLTGTEPPQPKAAAPHPVQARAISLPDWPLTAALALGVNLVIGGLGYLAYRLIRRRGEVAMAALLAKLSS